jgi:hypothetical protein
MNMFGVPKYTVNSHARRENEHTKRVPDLPYLTHQLSGGETWTDPQGGYPSGCWLIDGGIRT